MRHFLDLSDAGGDAIAAMLNDAQDRKAARADWPKGKPKFFLNEIEIVPTYYIAKQFRHQVTHDRLPRPSFSQRSFSRAET